MPVFVAACGDRATSPGGRAGSGVAGRVAAPVTGDDFAGSDACAGCHADQYAGWAASTHGRAGGEPGPETVIVPFDGTPIVFRDGRVLPVVDSAGDYIFVVRQDGRAQQRIRVDGVIGGGHMLGGGTQGFVSHLADGTVRFLPFDYSRQLDAWFCNTGSRTDEGWVPVDAGMALTDDVEKSLGVCFRCHALKDVVQEGYLPRAQLADFYALKLPVLGDDPYLPDGRVKSFAYQATHLSSSCYVDGSMTCVSCHEPHGPGYWDVNRVPLADESDDRQCTSCHAAKAADPEAHTFHPAGSTGAQCVSCHMPYLQHPEVGPAIPFARSDHTIPVPRPQLDGRLGLVSACRGCHTGRIEEAIPHGRRAVEFAPGDETARAVLAQLEAAR